MVNAHDDDDHHHDEPQTPLESTRLAHQTSIPNSPPPSFHSRASSIQSRERDARRAPVNSDLADAFDTDGDESEDDSDDRQRLVRSVESIPAIGTAQGPAPATRRPPPAQRQITQLPQTTATSASSAAGSARVYGGGIQSDGVFSNLSAKPERETAEKEELPPTYEQAAADAAPPYWETTILAPMMGGLDEVYIDGMPVGSFFSFFWNAMISTMFTLVGFLLTYLLHSSHAAKNGSRFGLGVTLIQYGFTMKGGNGGSSSGAGGMSASSAHMGGDGYASPPDPNSHDFDPDAVDGGDGGDGDLSGDWVAYALMIVGWFILIRSVADYLKMRRHEQLVLQSPDRGLGIPVIAEGESSETVV
ncbi:hypothetical protein B0T22DRAFT_499695 [Podospora appendiculata]|uniref:Metal homeostatis protein BSD2 n=1 Tax=Podospora appendiculata TaxID=314037 RepID=A0AAE0XCJ3_9PEZI|nr:hypothetical protein B0T22DRAFT_499695 [Podospora appendiculata]